MKEVGIADPARPILRGELTRLIENTQAKLENFLSGKQGVRLGVYLERCQMCQINPYHGHSDDCYNPAQVFEERAETNRFLFFKKKSETILITIKKTSTEILYAVWERKVLPLAEEVIRDYNSNSPPIKIVLMDAYRGKGQQGTLSLPSSGGELSPITQQTGGITIVEQ